MSDAAYALYLSRLANNISYYFLIVSSAIGIPTNMVSIFIFWRLSRNKTNMGYFGMWQTTVDAILLLTFLLVIRNQVIFPRSFASFSDSLCKFLTFYRRFMLHISSLMPVLATFDRVVFVLYGYGQRFKFMKSKLKMTACILVIFVIITIADIPNLFYYVKNNSCTADSDSIIASDIISIILRTYLPFALMIIMNTIMIRKIISNRGSTLRQTSLTGKEYQFTLAVIAYDVYFFLINFPSSLYYIFYDANLYRDAFVNNTLFRAQYNMVSAAAINLSYCSQTFSFFMFLAFNKLFRQELAKLVIPRRFRQVGQSTTLNQVTKTQQQQDRILSHV